MPNTLTDVRSRSPVIPTSDSLLHSGVVAEPYRDASRQVRVVRADTSGPVRDGDPMSRRTDIVTVLEPEDEFPHEPDAAENYNESMYLNAFDAGREVGGWFRLGNRVNEGYAEMTVCIYLPGGRVGFVYGRPAIDTNDKMEAGGLSIEVIQPFHHLKVRYRGKVCLLDDPGEMAEPRVAFKSNPWAVCEVDLDFRGVSPMYGGKPVHTDGTEVEQEAGRSFAKAHYEQHCAVTGTIVVGDEVVDLDGLGLRDKSWGPRYWQAISWYRWLPMTFSEDSP